MSKRIEIEVGISVVAEPTPANVAYALERIGAVVHEMSSGDVLLSNGLWWRWTVVGEPAAPIELAPTNPVRG
jgi:hypothetical protein